MELITQLESNRYNRVKGLFSSNVINNSPNVVYMSDPFINFDQAKIQDIIDNGNGRVLMELDDGSVSAAILMINDILEDKRHRSNPDLITSFYTLQEYAPWAHATKHLVGGNLVQLCRNAQYFSESWFTPSFLKTLGKLLHYYSNSSHHNECLSIYKILYFAIKKRIRLNLNVILESIKVSFLTVKWEGDPFNLLLILLAIHSTI